MGRRGPAAAPTQVKIARGETRPSRTNHDEPDVPSPASGALADPKGLAGVGLQEWRTQSVLLTDAGVLKATDLGVLEDYCRAVSDLRKFEIAARKAGPELAIAKGFAGMVIKVRAQCNQLRKELGLTPSSRAGIKADKSGGQSDDDERFFGGPSGVVRGGKS